MKRPTWLIAILVLGSRVLSPTAIHAQVLYVSNEDGTTVSSVNAAGTITNHSFATGLSAPSGLALDTNGNLYISNAGHTTVSEVGPGGGAAHTFANGLNDPRGLAFDTSGNLYVANYNAGAGTAVVQVNAAGTIVNPSFATGLNGPLGLAFDASGNLYISNFAAGSGATVSRVGPGGGAATTFAAGLTGPTGLAFFGGDLYIANFNTSTVSEVNALGTIINATYATGLNHPVGLAFDANGDLFVANDGMNAGTTISEVGPGGGAATVFANGLNVLTFLALQPVPEPSSLLLTAAGSLERLSRWCSHVSPTRQRGTRFPSQARRAHIAIGT